MRPSVEANIKGPRLGWPRPLAGSGVKCLVRHKPWRRSSQGGVVGIAQEGGLEPPLSRLAAIRGLPSASRSRLLELFLVSRMAWGLDGDRVSISRAIPRPSAHGSPGREDSNLHTTDQLQCAFAIRSLPVTGAATLPSLCAGHGFLPPHTFTPSTAQI